MHGSRLHALRGASTPAFVNAPEPDHLHAEEVYVARFLPFVGRFAGEPQRYGAWTAYRPLAKERQLFALPVSAPYLKLRKIDFTFVQAP
jgi:hypothetical protein